MPGSELVLVIGSGGREHALALKLSQSQNVSKVFVAPGNAGTAGVDKVTNVGLDLKDFEKISSWIKENGVTFVMVGPEDPLAAGIVDFLSERGIQCFGPTAAAAQIESSKDFAKKFMIRHSIPTAKFESFTDADKACKFINDADFNALVVKASGLAAGKGVVVASSRQEASEAAREMLTDKKFGGAGDVVVVEELLEGPEVSVLAFSDGHNVSLMPPAQDHKRLEDKDEGPNTGGMGAVCPYPELSESDQENIKKNVIERTVRGLAEEGIKYVGVLYAGLMLTKDGPKVLEFNCRFGDPETQSIMQLLTSDLLCTMRACVEGKLPEVKPTFDTSRSAVGVMVVSGGYPGSYKKGLQISGVSEVEQTGCHVIHSGTSLNSSGQLATSGGRVLSVIALDPSLSAAKELATSGAAKIQFDGAFHRKDIGAKILQSKNVDTSSSLSLKAVDEEEGLQYKDAGVDIMAGDDLVQAIKPLAKMTRRRGCDADLGGFGGLFDLEAAGLSSCTLTCSTWGVGRKIKFAENRGHHFNVGLELVARCVNDLLSRGAEPLYFLDYYAVGRLNVPVAEEVVKGMAEGCVQAGCALIGGETAEMPGMYQGSDYDVAGFAVGAIPQSQSPCTGKSVVALDQVVLGLTSSGLQYCDFGLLEDALRARNLNLRTLQGLHGGGSLAEEILVPSEIYTKSVLPLMRSGKIIKFACVNQGLRCSVASVLDDGLSVKLDAKAWGLAPVFGWMTDMAGLVASELIQNSSCGLAAILVVKRDDVTAVRDALSENLSQPVKTIGTIVEKAAGGDGLVIENLDSALKASKDAAYLAAPENYDSGTVSVSRQLPIMPDVKSTLTVATRTGAVVSEGHLPTFDVSSLGLNQPVLVSGTDGVGTKLRIAQSLDHHSSIGVDLVAMCVNDVLASGAEPLFFTSYFASGTVHPDWTQDVLQGVAEGCRQAGCALLEQKVSLLPSIYQGKIYDLGGFAVAAVEKSKILPLTSSIRAGDAVIGLPSSGIHSNGFSLVRRVVEMNGLRYDQPSPFTAGMTLGHDLLTPTRIYVKSVLPAMKSGKVKSFAHITGGGLVENIPRVMPPGLGVCLDASKWNLSAVFGWLQYMGKISSHEMSKTFNCGLGAVLVVSQSDVAEVMETLSSTGEEPVVVGSVVSLSEDEKTKVQIQNLQSSLLSSWTRPRKVERKKRVGVLISGSGTNLQALIDHTVDKENNSAAQISLVISNKAGVMGLTRAERAGIPTLVINHRNYKSREEFDEALHQALVSHGIELVCLAGFMRILTGGFVNKWTGRMLNIHPSLLPSFKGAHAQRMALEARVRISGCSVHFVAEEVDAGALLVQRSVPVYPGDTENTLSERIKTVEHGAFPAALEMVASEQVVLGEDGKLVWNW
ncbi:trifunctional purine biosynthetic protein adenosine-3 [Aplysia californica]|uniref:Trifunctional purine biosynthetic protein adenosine-3 n=1 Tax=Aplysia californica TaxID=6500 RepID=A0ABM1W369_APLCA|nr:trifunctional purine biosynthetic protein adenosine-3 [Aplysia californica]